MPALHIGLLEDFALQIVNNIPPLNPILIFGTIFYLHIFPFLDLNYNPEREESLGLHRYRLGYLRIV